MKRTYIIGIVAVVIIIIVVARYYKNEEFAPLTNETNEGNETNENQIVENFPTAPQNVLVSDSNGNLKATTDLGLQNLTVSNNGALLIGDKFRFNSNKDFWADDEWLRMSNKDNTNYYGGFATGKVWTTELHGAPRLMGGITGDVNASGGKLQESGAVLIPRGTIVMFNGAAAPAGWAICDGARGETPDLRNRFIVGAGASYGVGATGGADTVTLTVEQIPSHSHTFHMMGNANPGDNWIPSRGSNNPQDSGQTRATGGGQAHENRPPYYALTYIMKL
jgi:Phage Tail Collar Domain